MVTMGFAFAAFVLGGVGGYFYGRKAQKDNDNPVLVLREDQEGHWLQFPHHIHPHDQKK